MTSSTDPPVLVGRLGRPHGLSGHLTLVLETDNEARFRPGSRLFLADGEVATVRDLRPGGSGLIVAFEEVFDRNRAESWRGRELFIAAEERRPLGLDEYWPDELVGLDVRDPRGNKRGTIKAVDDSAPQARLIVVVGGAERIVPLVAELVPTVAMVDGYVVVVDLPGLLSDDSEAV